MRRWRNNGLKGCQGFAEQNHRLWITTCRAAKVMGECRPLEQPPTASTETTVVLIAMSLKQCEQRPCVRGYWVAVACQSEIGAEGSV